MYAIQIYIHIYKVLTCLCLFVWPLSDLPQILIGELGRTTGMFLAKFKNFKLKGMPFTGKIPGTAGFPS